MDEIAGTIANFIQAYNAGDIDAIARYYSDSLVKLREGAAPESKSDVISRIKSTLRDFAGRLEVTNDEIEIGHDLAFTRGSFVVTLTPRSGGQPTVIRSRFLEIWRREGGRWVVWRAMDNNDTR
jgi:ketosteroid isomerase-like protein